MTANDLKNRIDELCSIVSFSYKGKEGHVDPYSHSQYLLWFDGDEMMVGSIEEVMNTPFFAATKEVLYELFSESFVSLRQ